MAAVTDRNGFSPVTFLYKDVRKQVKLGLQVNRL